MADEPKHPDSPHERLDLMVHLTAPAIAQAARALSLPEGSHGLDAGCGAGCHTDLLVDQVGASGHLTSLDLSEENLEWARGHRRSASAVDWVKGDIRQLPFADASFDWVWCADTLWPGAVTNDPAAVLAEFGRVTKPGGTVALLYWSSQTLLAGYPALEARLNAAFVETVPYLTGIGPELHFLRAGEWLSEAGFTGTQARTFVVDVPVPADTTARRALAAAFEMFWGELASLMSAADWEAYQRLCDPDSAEFVVDAPGYYAFLTYTVFWARSPR
jgi:ubiquinone/menaquinone biosynthesis C-methylase UbiE